MKICVIYVLEEIRRLLDREAGTSNDEEDSRKGKPNRRNSVDRLPNRKEEAEE